MRQHATKLAIAAICVGLFGVASSVQAKALTPPPPGFCSASAQTGGISPGNVKLDSISATDCYGVVVGSNITSTDANVINNLGTWGSGWNFFADSEGGGATFMGLAFTVSATSGTSGSWTLTGTDTNGTAILNFPTSLDMVVGLKASNRYALWGFDNIVVDGSDNGTFSIVFHNNGGQIPDLSHLIVFGRQGTDGAIPPASVPETETWAMMLAGLGLVGLQLRRRNAGQHLIHA